MTLATYVLAGLILVAVPAPALSQSLGTVTAYNAQTFRTYNAEGTRISTDTQVSALPDLPATIVQVQPGGRIGIINRANERIFLRGMDIEFELNADGRRQAACRPVASGNRVAGAVVPSTRAGGGSSNDCAF